MKSAYELAMERMGGSGESSPLTDEQKAKIAEIGTLYESKIAGAKVGFDGRIAAAHAATDFMQVAMLEDDRRKEIVRLDAACEAEKEKVRASSAT